ncbi:1,3-beta-glucan synthase subunit FKS1-like, domain-1 [Phytophthora cactorum]|nr:1,3-beta-glucan synthase subunit FKS1-like, domain-1 [Phytophthora cactorum]
MMKKEKPMDRGLQRQVSAAPPRRRAASNYQTVEDVAAERGVSISRPPMDKYPQTQQPIAALTSSGPIRPPRPGAGSFELLQAKFGFQEGNVRNQKEHFECWVLNYESRIIEAAVTPVDTENAIETIHAKFFRNYVKWCQFLPPDRAVSAHLGRKRQLRFMPECLCFLYHKMAAKLDGIEKLPNAPEGTFLRRIVRPLYSVVAKMRDVTPQKNGAGVDHKNVTNYDDVNEFFWRDTCLNFETVNVRDYKTFKERRSFCNPILAFFRIYFFLFVMLHILVVIAYVAYRSDPDDTDGFKFYSNFFTSDVEDIRNHAFYSIFITISGLLALKVVLDVWIDGTRIFSRIMYAVSVFIRLVWHTVFFGLFTAVNAAPYKTVGSNDLLSMGPMLIGVYMAPIVIVSIVQMFFRGVIWRSAFLSSMDGTREQYIGRTMDQSWGDFICYGTFWTIIFVCKFMFNLQLMVKPLIGPSVEIYNVDVSAAQLENGIIESDHNIAFLAAMWAPVVLVYIYDSQIWLAIAQAIVGAWIGFRLKIGHSARINEFIKRLQQAPNLFDEKVVSAAARGQLAINNNPLSSSSVAPDANSRLRFAVVWNEVVSSFRLSDLLDDRETAILQYQISDTGAVEEPVFLIAGEAQAAADIAARAKTKRMSDGQLFKDLKKAESLAVPTTDTELIGVFHQILAGGRVSGVVNLTHIGLVRENVVDLLASILDLPEPTVGPTGGAFGFPHEQVLVVVQRVDALLKSIELMLEEEWMAEKLRKSAFAKITPDLAYQKEQLLSIFADRISQRDSNSPTRTTSPSSNESAQRRMSFFLNSLHMKIPTIDSIAAMKSFSVVTPYYNETVLFSVDELNGRVDSNPLFRKVEQKGRDLSILKYLITFHDDEWGNFLERVGVASMDEALAETPTQTLARTVHGMMMYEDALKMLRWLEIGSDENISHLEKIKHMDRIAGLKFSYVTSCQIYADQLAAGDSRAADIDLLMRKYPNWRVSYVDTIRPPAGSGTEPRFDCVLVKSDGDEIVEVYRYELPGNPMVGEGKPENQNVALPFTRGEYVQTIDMNQEHYFEEALKIPNFLATATQNGQNVTVIGMKEHIFTGRASSLAHFMTLQELVFVSLTQRVLANPLQSRMHYGHPDVFEKSFVMSNGGVSKASKGINLSEDVFAGYNVALRGEKAKLSNGSAESSLSRESHRMGAGMDFFRLNSMFYGHMGFYICNALVVLCVFAYAYGKVYIVLHQEIEESAIITTSYLDDLAELIVTLGPVFYIFETGTKSHFYDVAIMRGGSKYRGTGRGFAIVRETMVNFYKEYAASHYRKAVELMGLMIIFGTYGNFSIGTNSKGQDYGIASFAVWLLGTCWLLAPFLFNTDGLDFSKTRVDITYWLSWLMSVREEEEEERLLPNHLSSNPSGPRDTWNDFYNYEASLMYTIGPMSRFVYAPERHWNAVGGVGAIAIVLWIGGFGLGMCLRNKARVPRAMLYVLMVVIIGLAPFVVGPTQDWDGIKCFSLTWGLVRELAFFFDVIVGLFLAIPLLVLSAFPFMKTIQTRMMYNGGFSRALSSGSEFAASLSVVVGGLGGFTHGWLTCLIFSLGYVNSSSDNFVNESFIYYNNETLDGALDLTMIKVSCLVTFAGCALVWLESSSMVLIGICLASAGIAMLSLVCPLYNFEICMQGWKGKGVLMFLTSAALGYMIEAVLINNINATTMSEDWGNSPYHDWQWQFIFGIIPIVLLVPVMFFLPESHYWEYRRRNDTKVAEAALTRLRQRHDVMEEVSELKDSFVVKSGRVNVPFRIVLVIVLQATFAIFTSGALLHRVLVQPSPSQAGAQTSKWQIYYGIMTFIGAVLSLLTVDNLRRKTIFKDQQDSVITQILVFVAFVSGALSLTCGTWLTAIEVFPPYQNGRYIIMSFVVYYAVQAAIYVVEPSFAISHLIFAGLCLLLTVFMFVVCASSKYGAIELKSEKKMRKDAEAARNRPFLRSRSNVRRSSSHYSAAALTPQEGSYSNFESPAGLNLNGGTRRTLNGSQAL